MTQKKLPLINSAHGSETRNIINELIKLFNTLGYTYDEALINAHNILNEAQKTNDKNKDVQQQINTLILESGKSDAEVLQARIDSEGNEYPVLKDRLDENDAQLAQTTTKQALNESKAFRGNRKKQPLVSFVDDDGFIEVLTVLKPLAIEKGFPYCVATLNNSVILDHAEELRDLQNNHGWEFVSHSSNQAYLTDYTTEQEILDDVMANVNVLASHGLKCETISYPYGASNGLVRDACSKVFKVGMSSSYANPVNEYPLHTMDLKRVSFKATAEFPEWGTLQYHKDLIDDAYDRNIWLIYMTHVYGHTPEENQLLRDIVDYIQLKNIEIVTVSEAIDRVGNTVEVRDYQNDNKFVVDCEGKVDSNYGVDVRMSKEGLSSSSPITDFPFKKISHHVFLNTDNAGFPHGAGTLITNRVNADYEQNVNLIDIASHQIYILLDGRMFVRNWNYSTGAWKEWSEIITSQNTKATLYDYGTKTETTPSSEYADGFSMHRAVSWDVDGAKHGIVETYKVGVNGYDKQFFKQNATNAIWQRGTNSSDGSWTTWERINGANGTTGARPTTSEIGYQYFDRTLGKPIWLKSTPSTWVDATGTVV